MTYTEFKKKYNGKYIDVDNQYGPQCWDLGQRYFTECLKVPASVLGGCGLVSNMLYPPKRKELDKYFNEVPTTKMKQGDVLIWEYGHIAIYDHWDGNNCWCFSQNPNPCKVIAINHGGLHAFRLKGVEPQPTDKVNVYYKVRTKEDGWLPEVKNLDDYAGQGKHTIIDFMVKVDKGSIWYQAHIKGGKWLPKVTGYNEKDFYNGYAGESKPIDCVRIYYNDSNKKAKYRINNLPWVYNTQKCPNGDDFAGNMGENAYKLEITIE